MQRAKGKRQKAKGKGQRAKGKGQRAKGIYAILYALCIMLLTSCQPPALTPKGTVINKTNLNFLKEAGVDEKTNPHTDQKCKVCHTAPDDLLIKGNPADNEILRRRFMRTDLINLCSKCHKASAENEHSVGVETKLNRQNLPLDHEEKITCAVTCHDVHTKAPGLRRFFLRTDTNALCFSCHDV